MEENNIELYSLGSKENPITPFEVTVTYKRPLRTKIKSWINDNILLNKGNIRVKNKLLLLSTYSGRVIDQAFREGNDLAAKAVIAPIAVQSLNAAYAVPEIAGTLNLYGAYKGSKLLLGNNGVIKTYNKFKDGNVSEGVKSLGGDILDIAMTLPFINLVKRISPLVINLAQSVYNTGKDALWLGKLYNSIGTGLINPYIRRIYFDLLKNPTLSKNFILTYSRSKESGLTFDMIKEAIPLLQDLLLEYKIIPKAMFNDYSSVSDLLNHIKSGLFDAKNLADRYNNGMKLLSRENPILYNIAKESPLYLDKIITDFKTGKITNIEQYIKDLIKQSNTFLRRMDLPEGTDVIKAFSKIKGKSFSTRDFALDVGNPEVVFNPIWSQGYGNTLARYSPKEIKLEGPIETWWSLRFPKFKDTSITILANGMHTNNYRNLTDLDTNSVFNFYNYLKLNNIPIAFGRTDSHMIFTSPNKEASIGDFFNIEIIKNKRNIFDTPYTLGYKNGGKINAIKKS